MELRHLRYFVAVAEELHFGRAAARLGMAQPPLSQQIRKLEAELGFPLFTRTKRTVQLTRAGKVFLSELGTFQDGLLRAQDKARRAHRGELGPVIVACDPIAVSLALPCVLPAFRERLAGVEIRVREALPTPPMAAIETGSVDAGLLVPCAATPGVEQEEILRLPMSVAVPRKHRLAGRRSIAMSQLASEPFVALPLSARPQPDRRLIDICQRCGFAPRIAVDATSLVAGFVLIGAGYGVSLVPGGLGHLAGTDVVLVPIRAPRPMIEVAVAWRQNDASPALAGFLDVVRSCFEDGAPRRVDKAA